MSKQLGPLVAQYVRGRRARQEISERTAKLARHTLLKFVDIAGWETDPCRVNRRHVLRFMERKVSQGTLRNEFSVLQGFIRWLVDEGMIRRDVTAGIRRPQEPERPPRGLTLAQVQAVLTACTDTREELIVLLQVQAGCRVGEVARIQIGHIDFAERLLLVHGKGGKQRVVALPDELFETILVYLRQRPARVGFLVRHAEYERGLVPSYVSGLTSRIMHRGGVEESGHALRHTFVTDMLRAGAHIRDTQRAAGHSALTTTERYMPWLVGDLHDAMGGRRYKPDRRPKRRAVGGDDEPTGGDAA